MCNSPLQILAKNASGLYNTSSQNTILPKRNRIPEGGWIGGLVSLTASYGYVQFALTNSREKCALSLQQIVTKYHPAEG